MNTSIVLLALFSVAFARPGDYADFSTDLKEMTEEARKQVQWLKNAVEKIPAEYDRLAADRFECLMWQCKVQPKQVNETVSESVSKGMLNNKPSNNFQCIGTAAAETYKKLRTICDKISNESETLKKNSLEVIASNGLIFDGFIDYADDLYKKKSEELEKAKNDNEKKKIFEVVKQKMQHSKTVLDQIFNFVKTIKEKFFESYIVYAYNTEETLKKIQKDGSQKIRKCVA